MSVILFLSVFLIAACGLIYELIAGTLASYLLGDSVFQFSTVIGAYLFAMGIGFLCRRLGHGILSRLEGVGAALAAANRFVDVLLSAVSASLHSQIYLTGKPAIQ